jgi:hypothetical protein
VLAGIVVEPVNAEAVLTEPDRGKFLGEGVPVNVMQKQLGHVSLATTDVYLW